MRKQIGLLIVAATLVGGLAPASCEAGNLSRLLGAQRPVAQTPVAPASRAGTPVRTALAARGEQATPGLQAPLRATPRFPVLRALILLYLLWNGYN